MIRCALILSATLLGGSWPSFAHAGTARAAGRPIPADKAREIQQRLRAKYGQEMALQAKVLHGSGLGGGKSLAEVILKAQSLADHQGTGQKSDLDALWRLLQAARNGKLDRSAPAGLADLSKLAAQYAPAVKPAESPGGLDLPVPQDVAPAALPGAGPDALLRTLQQTNPALLQKAMQILKNPQAADPAVQAALQGVLRQRGPDGKPTPAARGLRRLLNNPGDVDKLQRMVGALKGLTPPDAAAPAGMARRRVPAAGQRSASTPPAAPGASARPAPHGAVSPAKAPRLKLSGILSAPGGNVAILNGRAVRAGQTVAGFRVLKIEVRRVTVTKDGRHLTLPLRR